MPTPHDSPRLTITRHGRHNNIYKITMHKLPENRLNKAYAQEIIAAFRWIEEQLGKDSAGAVITTSTAGWEFGGERGGRGVEGVGKFWCTGLELDETDVNPYANSDGFYPLLHTILDFPFPTIALITGHTFGGACPFALSHDYRIMNSKKGFISMPPIDLGLHFDGIGTLPRLKLRPQIARKMLLEAHKWTGKEALADGVVDAIGEPAELENLALELAEKWAPKARMGVYGILRQELYGEASVAFRKISYVHHRETGRPAKAKI